MKKVLGSMFVMTMLFATQGRASGCGPGLQADVREEVMEAQVQGIFTCTGPSMDTNSYRCDFVSNDPSIPTLSYNWVESYQLPAEGAVTAVTVKVHNALMFDECYGPGLEAESNAFYYILNMKGVRYANYQYK